MHRFFWDGRYLDIGSLNNRKREMVDQLQLTGGEGHLVKSLIMQRQREAGMRPQFYVTATTVIQVLDVHDVTSNIYSYTYPKGQLISKIRLKGFGNGMGLTLSVAPSK